jgi:hypothetical protein
MTENKTLTCGFGGALGGTRTPNLLIRRYLHSCPRPAHMPLTCRNAAQRCVVVGGVERCCEARMRPVEVGQPPQARGQSTVKPSLTVDLFLIRHVRRMRSSTWSDWRPGHGSRGSDRGCPLGTVIDCPMWHAGGTAGENDRASHSVADASARPMGEVGTGRHESRWQGRQPATADRPRSSPTAPRVAAGRIAFRIGQGGQCAAG